MKYIDYFKKFIKENIGVIIFLVLFYLFMNYELPYVVYRPGGAINLSKRVFSSVDYKEEGSFNMTYVSVAKGSIPFYLASKVIPSWDAIKKEKITYDGKSLKETEAIDKVYMDEANSNAIYNAFKEANIDYKVSSTENIITYTNEKVKDLLCGDIILRVDNINVRNMKEVQNYIKTKKIGDRINVLVKRNNKEKLVNAKLIDIGGEPKLGIVFATIYNLDSKYDIEIKSKKSESGPSGGLMTSLEVYNAVTKNDITKGRKIMGTGTISLDGEVGEIGGVKYKLLGASKKGADIFICPKKNYREALKVKKEHNLKLEIYGVKTFDEAISKLKG